VGRRDREPGPGGRRRAPPQQPLRADQGLGGADGRAVRPPLRHERPRRAPRLDGAQPGRGAAHAGAEDLRLLRQPRRRRAGASPPRSRPPDIGFEIVYAASRGGERVFDMEPGAAGCSGSSEQRWPEGPAVSLPDG
jgi:hypothetical protein